MKNQTIGIMVSTEPVVAIGLNVVNWYAYHNRLASGTLSLVRRWCPALEKSFDRLRLVGVHHFHY